MRIKKNFSPDIVVEKLKLRLPDGYVVRLKKNSFFGGIGQWVDISDRNSCVGIRVEFYSDWLLLTTYVPNVFFDLLFFKRIPMLFYFRKRRRIKKKIRALLLFEFYDKEF